MFVLEQVSKHLGGVRVIDTLSLELKAQQTTAILGPSGCGKSTLLRLLLGLSEPDTGRVSFAGNTLNQFNHLKLRQRMGYVIQDGGLFPHLTARQNITLMAQHLHWSPVQIDTRLDELAELTRFPAAGLSRYPGQLSGGQKQRVSLMRALMLDPEAILLDEPLGALDPLIRVDLQEDLRTIFDRLNKTVVLVTHDMSEAAYLAHTLCVMNKGKILQQGMLHELWHSPSDAFVRRFLHAQRSPLEDVAGDSRPPASAQ